MARRGEYGRFELAGAISLYVLILACLMTCSTWVDRHWLKPGRPPDGVPAVPKHPPSKMDPWTAKAISAYDAYRAKVADPLPPWADLPGAVRATWETAVRRTEERDGRRVPEAFRE